MAKDDPILIVGGGLGGLTTALALARHGMPARVLEGAPSFGAIGYGIQFGPNVFQVLDRIGVSVVFTTTAVVIAICFVAGPFYLRQAIAAFETLDNDVLDAARVDGAGPLRVLTSVSIPLAKSGLAAGAALAFATLAAGIVALRRDLWRGSFHPTLLSILAIVGIVVAIIAIVIAIIAGVASS